MAALLAALTLLCLGLGVWQLERRAWKLDLIATVEARLRARPAPAPGPRTGARCRRWATPIAGCG
jgi:surfeit locus 1 family protein